MTVYYYAHLDVSSQLIRIEHGLPNTAQKLTNHGSPLCDIVTINMDERSRGPCMLISSAILLRHVGDVDIDIAQARFKDVLQDIRDCLICPNLNTFGINFHDKGIKVMSSSKAKMFYEYS
jgi:hypothetical protein